MNRGIFITVGACLGFMSLIMALFLSRFYTPRELTLDEYKTLGAYFIDPPRQLAEFKLIDDSSQKGIRGLKILLLADLKSYRRPTACQRSYSFLHLFVDQKNG